MGHSSEQYLALQEQEFYRLSQKEIGQLAEQHAREAIEAEQHDIYLAQLKRVAEYVEKFEKALKTDLIDKINGQYYSTEIDVKLSHRTTPTYEEDAIYRELNEQLKERKKLLDMRIKLSKVIFDENGEEVPLIGSKTTDFLTIKLK
jgi:hypothetical protein